MASILIVEDNFLIRELTEMTIQDWGYDTFSAGDADEALLLLNSSAEVDLLFTDIHLKFDSIDGCELARKAIQIRPNLKLIYTTGNTLTPKLRSLFIEGAPCLVKPYTPLQLKNALNLLLNADVLDVSPA